MIFFSIFKWSYLNFLLKYSWCINFWCTARWFSFILYIYIYLHIYMYYAKSCLTLLWPHGLYSPPGSSVHGISQARILKWVAISFSRGSSNPGIEPQWLLHWMWIFYHCTTWELLYEYIYVYILCSIYVCVCVCMYTNTYISVIFYTTKYTRVYIYIYISYILYNYVYTHIFFSDCFS